MSLSERGTICKKYFRFRKNILPLITKFPLLPLLVIKLGTGHLLPSGGEVDYLGWEAMEILGRKAPTDGAWKIGAKKFGSEKFGQPSPLDEVNDRSHIKKLVTIILMSDDKIPC